MSVPPPGFKTPPASPQPAPEGAPLSNEDLKADAGSRRADRTVQHEFKSVHALRGREGSAKAKWLNQGWELVSETQGTLRTELNFRRVRPDTIGDRLLRFVAAYRRLAPKTQLILAASAALSLVAGIGVVAGTQSEKDTDNARPAQASAPNVAQTQAPAAAPVDRRISDITVDGLYDKLNSPDFAGIKVGDRFKVTGELAGADHWTTGASGDFGVLLKTTEGSDLNVFIDESETDGWQDGTRVEMVVEMVEVTIDGETTDGWLAARSAKTISTGVARSDDEGKSTAEQQPGMTRGQENALEAGQNYVDIMPFSKARLIQQLSSSAGDQYSKADATFAANHVDADWNEEAVEAARNYLDTMPMSKAALIRQLSSSAGDKYTRAQARYAASRVY